VGDYCRTLDSLYHYYDRCSSLSGQCLLAVDKIKLADDDVASRSYRYAALGLAATQFRFGHRSASLIHVYCMWYRSEVTVTVTTVTCSAPLQSNWWRIPKITQCSQCKQHETENSSVCSWMMQSNARVSSRSAADSKHRVRQQRKSTVTNLPTRSWYDQVTVPRQTQRRPWRNVGGGRRQAGNVIRSVPGEHLMHKQAQLVLYSLWSATSSTPAKQPWHGRGALSLVVLFSAEWVCEASYHFQLWSDCDTVIVKTFGRGVCDSVCLCTITWKLLQISAR